jgi:hypothetical protein
MSAGWCVQVRRRALMLEVSLASAVCVLLAVAGTAAGSPPQTVTPTVPAEWQGPVANGANINYDATSGEPCGETNATRCDATLVEVQAGDFYETSGGGVEFSISDTPGNDFDLYVYESTAAGTRGPLVGSSAGPTDVESTAVINADGFYLVQVVYFAVASSGYEGRAEFFRRAKFPPDVDDPPGLQDILASDPLAGWRSHSEMHAAQNPLDPRQLVAVSKFYNKDPDSLPEYEFKNGSYASFNYGRSWLDLGQTNTCPQEQAPPSSWPLDNDCYPADDPTREGTGPEDDPPGGDYGEQYITSDPWVDWDDEGNAYFMMLDSPPFPSGAGWGMSFHRWESPSRRDARRGNTWSDRIIINAYETEAEREVFLDDKNTFAVNNAGRDRDGRTGIMVACWGQNGPFVPGVVGPQQVVCERSTDGGRSWPDEPTPVSPGPTQPLVIAPHVVADTRNPNTFYVVWLEYFSGLVDGSGTNTFYFSKSVDGGVTWSPATPVQRILPLPGVFPQQAFRNLSIPIMAVGPRSQLYVTYADYNPASSADEDGMQADIKLTRSLDGGATLSAPRKVNQDVGDADQFQQYIRVTENGQLNVFFFDRRNDPDNFFIDNFLARSNDGGTTWQEVRLSHDMWDPSINPPISGSGEFIGDYQGLVADDCFAIPFVNDTHLANDPFRDPDFDRRLPRSPFQEAISYRVPNRERFGGDDRECGRDRDDDDDDDRGDDDDDRDRKRDDRGGDRRRARSAVASVSRARVRELAEKHQIIIGSSR